MQAQFAIPSFNPSLASSRKSQMQTPDLLTNKHNFNKKLFEPETVQAFNYLQQDPFQARCGEQFWESLYAEQNAVYKTMMNKYTLLEESIKLHKQALTLRNSEYIDHEDRISNLTTKIKYLTGKAKENEKKISGIGSKCHQAKSHMESIRSKIHKEQSIIIEQEKHVDDLHRRMASMQEQMKGIQNQLEQAIQKQEEYGSIVQENERLLLTLNKMKSQANFAKIKIDRDWSEEENIVRKMKQLEKIIKMKEKNNRELGKKLVQVKKLNPEVSNMMTQSDKSIDKGSKVKEIMNNIKQMEDEYGKIQQQIYEISEKIYNLSDKMEEKIKTIEIIKMKQKNQPGSENEPNIYHPAVLKNPTKNNTHDESKFPSNVLETNEQSTHNAGFMKKPRTYKIIQSQQNEHYLYPKSTGKNQTIDNEMMSKKLQKSQTSQSQGRQYSEREKSEELVPHSRQRSQDSKEEEGDHNLEIDENLRKLVKKFHTYKNNSLFKH